MTDQIVQQIRQIAERHGYSVIRDERSRLSVSRYLSLGRREGWAGFDAPKSGRRRFCHETGMSYPSHLALNVRVSDHHGHGDGTTVHLSVRTDLDVAAALAQLDGALALLAETSR